MAKAKTYGSGWHKQSVRHSNARKHGQAGGKYAVKGHFRNAGKPSETFVGFHYKSEDKADKLMFLGSNVLASHKETSGESLSLEPMRTEFLREAIKLGKISDKEADKLEDQNFHTELRILREEGLANVATPKSDLELKNLEQFHGTEKYHKITPFTKAVGTDGIAYIEENGYGWFVSDQIIKAEGSPKLRNEPFLAIKLKTKPDGTATATIEDGNGKVLTTQKYEWTDAKKDLTLFYTDGVLMLAGEY